MRTNDLAPTRLPDRLRDTQRLLFIAKHAKWTGGLHSEDGNHALYHRETREILEGLGIPLLVNAELAKIRGQERVEGVDLTFKDGETRELPADSIVAAMDAAIEPLRTTPVDQATLERARVKLRSQLYQEVEQFAGFGRANLLASFALFDDDPARINELEAGFAKVTPELLMQTARDYRRPTNRTIELVVPAAPAGKSGTSSDR